MPLTYRGVTYTQSAAKTIASDTLVAGKYRGAEIGISHPASAPRSQYQYNLKYRGISYPAASNDAGLGGLAPAF
jgi:hypothetical protein